MITDLDTKFNLHLKHLCTQFTDPLFLIYLIINK